ncbi:MAG: hypothetical protein LBB04_02125 [Oscillospiraceae bacterium]|nr:hypothetical protein [Oscillospiraceae bacterium]
MDKNKLSDLYNADWQAAIDAAHGNEGNAKLVTKYELQGPQVITETIHLKRGANVLICGKDAIVRGRNHKGPLFLIDNGACLTLMVLRVAISGTLDSFNPMETLEREFAAKTDSLIRVLPGGTLAMVGVGLTGNVSVDGGAGIDNAGKVVSVGCMYLHLICVGDGGAIRNRNTRVIDVLDLDAPTPWQDLVRDICPVWPVELPCWPRLGGKDSDVTAFINCSAVPRADGTGGRGGAIANEGGKVTFDLTHPRKTFTGCHAGEYPNIYSSDGGSLDLKGVVGEV